MTDPFAAFRDAMERRDVDAAVRLSTPDCTLSSRMRRTSEAVQRTSSSTLTTLREQMVALLS